MMSQQSSKKRQDLIDINRNNSIGIARIRESCKLQESQKNTKNYFVMGLSGQGKTSLSLMLGGQQLIGKENDGGDMEFCRYQPSNFHNAIISSDQNTSETSIPNFIHYQPNDQMNINIIDNPGGEDSNGVVADISNGFYIYNLFQNLNQISFILVIEGDSFKGKKFTQVLDSMGLFLKGFKNTAEIFDHVYLCISKCQPSKTIKQYQSKLDDILKQKDEQIENKNRDIDPKEIKTLVKSLKDRIFLFKEPEEEGQIVSIQDYPEFKIYLENNDKFIPSLSKNSKIAICEQSLSHAESLFDESNDILIETLQNLASLLIDKGQEILGSENQQCENIANQKKVENEIINKSYHLFFQKCQTEDVTKQVIREKISHFKSLLLIIHIYQLCNALEQILSNQVTIKIVSKAIINIFQILTECQSDEKIQELEEWQKNIENKIAQMEFCEQVCYGNKKIDLSKLSFIFQDATYNLKRDNKTGVQKYQLCFDIESELYYQQVIDIIKQGTEKQQKKNKKLLSNCYYCLGNIYQNQEKYQLSLDNFRKSLNFYQNEYKDQIFSSIKDIYCLSPILDNIDIENYNYDDACPYENEVFKLVGDKFKKFSKDLYEKITIQLVEFNQEFLNQPQINFKQLENIFRFHKVQQNMSKICQLKFGQSFYKGNEFIDLVKNILILLNDQEREKLDLQLKKQCKALIYTGQIVPLGKFSQMDNEKIVNEYNYEYYLPILSYINKYLVSIIIGIQIKNTLNYDNEEYYKKLIRCFSILPKNKKAIQLKAQTLEKLGDLSNSETQGNDESLQNYLQAIKFDNGLVSVHKKIANIYQQQKNYLNAFNQYKLLNNFKKCKLCLAKLIENGKTEEKQQYYILKAEYLGDEGLFDKAINILKELRSELSQDDSNFNKVQNLITKYMDPEIRQQVFEQENQIKDKILQLLPYQDWENFQESDEILQDSYQ